MAIIKQRVLLNTRLSDNVGIWESSIFYEVLYFVFKVEAITGLMVGFLVEVVIFIEVPSRRYEVRHGVGSKGLINPLEDSFSYA